VRLGQVEALRVAVASVEQQMHTAAVQARESGATWQEIGAALGITAKSAWKRYVA
jgi:hypothetical protein